MEHSHEAVIETPMEAVPVAHWVVKDVALAPSQGRRPPMRGAALELASKQDSKSPADTASPSSCCLGASICLAPTRAPTFFIRVDTYEPGGRPSAPRGLQFVEEGANRFQFLNLPDWSVDCRLPPPRRTLLRVQLADDTVSPVRVVFADGDGGHRPLAELAWDGQEWKVITDTSDEDLCSPPALKGLPDLFFVGGAPKSGTTWVEKIINAHPLALCVGEGSFFSRHRAAALCELMTDERWNCATWSLPRTQVEFEVDCYLAGRALYAFRRYAGLWPGLTAIGDRSPENAVNYRVIWSMLGACKLIHCVRHPLDVIVSRMYHEWNLYADGNARLCHLDESQLARLDRKIAVQGDALRLDMADVDLVDYFLDEWTQANKQALACKVTGDDNILFLKYENLLLDVHHAVDEIFRFLFGKPVGAGPVMDSIVGLSSFKYLSGGRDRGATDSRSFFRKGIADDYRGRFDPALVEYAWQRVGALAESLGYSVDRRRRGIRFFASWRDVRSGAS